MINRRWRSTAVSASMVAALSVALTGCAEEPPDDPDYRGVCVDPSGIRLDDEACDDEEGGHSGGHTTWVFFPRGSTVPQVGKPAGGGVKAVPQGRSAAYGGAPKAGGQVARGGFGGNGHGRAGSVGG